MTAHSRSRLVPVLIVAILLVTIASSGSDWPQFRGQRGVGTSPETNIADQWSESGPAELWRRQVGDGFSAISVVGKRLITMFASEGENAKEHVAAFDADTGKEIWSVPIADRFDEQFGDGPRSTPSIVGDAVIALGSLGDLVCLALEDGQERWRVSLTEEASVPVPQYGFSTSPVVDGDLVVVECGGKEGSAFMAFGLADGKVRWSFGDGSGSPGYSTPVIVEGPRGRFVAVAGTTLNSFDHDGNEVWTRAWPRGETHSSPLPVGKNQVFLSGAGKIGAVLISVPEEGEVTDDWTLPTMRNHFGSSVVVGDFLYGFDNATLKCVALSDASQKWSKRGFGKGSLIAVDGKLVLLTDRGKLVLIAATDKGYEELGQVQALKGKCWTAPVVSGGKVYLRNHDEMVSYDVAG